MKKTFRAPAIVVIFLLSAIGMRTTAASAGQTRSATSGSWADSVRNAPHFLVRLDQELNTGKNRNHEKFQVQTIEPLVASNGHIFPVGTKILGHISRIEPGGLTGRARVWLTFDDVETARGTLPIVAEVSSVPGEFSVQTGKSKEGEITARTGKGAEVAEATAVGAAKGSATGVTSHNGKEAAIGAAAGGMAAFLASSGIGQEIDLPKGTKLELVLDRPLYMN
ncbi:MAG TPA: hypothetical protein VG272_07040 [Candidatus Acidoferrales bacterium]|nr:hypothetical protein [Candidatus Acidoferrales bacterium]